MPCQWVNLVGCKTFVLFHQQPIIYSGWVFFFRCSGEGGWESVSLHRLWTQLCHLLHLSHSKSKQFAQSHFLSFSNYVSHGYKHVISWIECDDCYASLSFFLPKSNNQSLTHLWSVLNCSWRLLISTTCCCVWGQEVNSSIRQLVPLIRLPGSVWYDFDCLLAIYPATASSLSSPHLIQTFS